MRQGPIHFIDLSWLLVVEAKITYVQLSKDFDNGPHELDELYQME